MFSFLFSSVKFVELRAIFKKVPFICVFFLSFFFFFHRIVQKSGGQNIVEYKHESGDVR